MIGVRRTIVDCDVALLGVPGLFTTVDKDSGVVTHTAALGPFAMTDTMREMTNTMTPATAKRN